MSDATRFLRLPEVVARCGYSKPSVYRLVKEGKFPAPRKLGERAVGWLEGDIEAWCRTRQPAPQGVQTA